MANKKQERYYQIFVEMSTISCDAARLLYQILKNFDPDQVGEYIKNMHVIEHSGDLARHSMVKLLAKEFITPIEREDIMELSMSIDQMTDKIEDVLQKMYMYNIKKIRKDAIETAEILIDCTESVKLALEEFHNFKKSKTINDQLIEVNRLEEVGDKLYMENTRGVFTDPDITPLEAFAWSHIYHYMEDVFDSCEDTAEVIEDVIMKNS